MVVAALTISALIPVAIILEHFAFGAGLRHASYVNPDGPEAADEIEALISHARAVEAENARYKAALEKVERWFGEFPETGKFWLNEDGTESDRPMSYGASWGSNGERDYMRAIARAALTEPRAGEGP